MRILGITAFIHDSAACLVVNGKLIANVEEERLNRKKHTRDFPAQAIAYLLNHGDLTLSDIDIIAFNWNPKKSLFIEILKLVLAPHIYFQTVWHSASPKNFHSIWSTFGLKRALKKNFKEPFLGKIEWINHHHAHAASTYYLAPFNKSPADILVVDGQGEASATTIFSVSNNCFTVKKQISFINSLGIIYNNFTRFLGFDEHQEGKTMALAAFGKASYRDFFEKLLVTAEDGGYRLKDKGYLGLWNYHPKRLEPSLGSPRKKNAPLEQRHYDIAFSMQNRIKEIILNTVKNISEKGGATNLALAGGVFLNCDINKAIIESKCHQNIFAPPCTSDTGGAIGAALYAAHALYKEPVPDMPWFSPYLGPEYSAEVMVKSFQSMPITYIRVNSPEIEAAQALSEGKVLAWFQGRVEIGPRALGNRSILANPTLATVQDLLNEKIKNREKFRPFAPIVTLNAAIKFFELEAPLPLLCRYMLMTCSVKDEYRLKLPGITHVDGSARIQIVEKEWNPRLYKLLLEFEKLSGYAVLINTSFNRHEPIVCSPKDAVKTFLESKLDALYMGDFQVIKAEKSN